MFGKKLFEALWFPTAFICVFRRYQNELNLGVHIFYSKMRIAGVLDVVSKTRYGMTSRGVPMYLLKPLNYDMPEMVCACSIKNPQKNILVVAEPMPSNDRLVRGRIVHYIGECDDEKAQISAIYYAYTPYYWTEFRMDGEPSMEGRMVLDVDTANIDPTGCEDIDDCISFWDHNVAITIADVAEWVHSNADMGWARKIGQTFYDNGKAVRKLFLNEHQLSLIPGERRLGISLMFQFINGVITNLEFKEVVIINKKTYTYENCKEWKYANRLRHLSEVISGKTLDDPHDWIAEVMIFYNKNFATCLAEIGKGLLRGHDEPSQLKVQEYEKLGLPSHLAYSSAKYYPATTNIRHWGLSSLYCHATSPIRRFADVFNQMAFKRYPLEMQDNDDETLSDELNCLQKYSKRFEKDLKFSREIASKRRLSGIVVSETRIWCNELQCLISCKNTRNAGDFVSLKYFYDPKKSTWKTRLVFRVWDTTNTCPLSPE